MNRRVSSFTALLFVFLLLVSVHTKAQIDRPGELMNVNSYAITNAKIVTAAGTPIDKGTVIIRDGLIRAVGTDVKIPSDVRVIDGAGLTVYPGLIDTVTNLGIPAQQQAATGGRPGASPREDFQQLLANAGQSAPVVKAEATAAEQIKPGGDQVESWRNAGFTSVLSIPRDGIVLGQSAVINLAGDKAEDLVARTPVALHISFAQPRFSFGYPNSLMGVITVIRQSFLDAKHYATLQEQYRANPRGLKRPDFDRSLEALLPALKGDMPVIFTADSEREIHRALDIAQEFNLKAVIAGGSESYKCVERLQRMNVPVLLSLNFPKRNTSDNPEADPESMEVLRARAAAPKTAGKLAAAKIPFAFQSGGMTSIADFLANVQKSKENGLDAAEAVQAMTMRAAELLGVADRLGSVEVGKIANLTVLRGDIFDSKRKVAYVFIDGKPVNLKAAGSTASEVSGKWALKTDLGEGETTLQVNLKQEQGALTAALQAKGAPDKGQPAAARRTDDNSSYQVLFTLPLTVGGQTVEGAFRGIVVGNEMTGTLEIKGRAPVNFSGKKSEERPAPGAGGKPDGAAPVDVAGTWNLTLNVGGQTLTPTLVLKQQGASVTGTLVSQFGPAELSEGTVNGSTLTATATVNVGGQSLRISINGTVTGNQMEGTITSPQGAIPFTGTKP
ncbi:MAG: amidohydrolase family protein [Blastocatellia bacterium]|nr:amidohydrolase family protein [Blastocatellia bacterium]